MEIFIYMLIAGAVAKKLYDFRNSHNNEDEESEPETKPDSLKFISVYNKVHELNKTVDKLEKLEQFITDIQCCDDTHMKAVQIEVPNAVGENSSHQIIINGNDCHSNRLLAIALDDRRRMRAALLSEIESLYLDNAVTKTETKTTGVRRNKDAGEDYNNE